jgi:3',5'-cyclic AMP phosphodiesterase CpdA
MIKIIRKVAHLADIHVPKLHKRHGEFRSVFNKTVAALRERKPDRIVLVGDLFHDKLNLSNEALMLAAEFLNALAEIAPVVIARGNHDFNIMRKDRIDCIDTLVALMQNEAITYYKKSGFYVDDNVVWVVWHHGDHFSPWNELENPTPDHEADFHFAEIVELIEEKGNIAALQSQGYRFINLFHDPVDGCKLYNGMSLSKDTYLSVDRDFKGDYAFLGDIHKRNLFPRADGKVTVTSTPASPEPLYSFTEEALDAAFNAVSALPEFTQPQRKGFSVYTTSEDVVREFDEAVMSALSGR